MLRNMARAVPSKKKWHELTTYSASYSTPVGRPGFTAAVLFPIHRVKGDMTRDSWKSFRSNKNSQG